MAHAESTQTHAPAENPNPPCTEVFHFKPHDPEPAGYYWWFRWPGELPCSSLNGPFDTEEDALADAALIANCKPADLPRYTSGLEELLELRRSATRPSKQ